MYMQKKTKLITMSKAINEALVFSMKKDKKLLCFGLGTTDPKGIFSTTINLENKFGNKRVFDVPASENALTGISIGLSLEKIRSVVTHQRADFFLLAMDQLVNTAAKWFFMFGQPIPITIRLIIGRGWGQGPTHSQNFHSWFAHIPGLKVVMPSNPKDAKNLLISSIFDPNPVIFIEHRWLHEMTGKIDIKTKVKKLDEIGKCKIIQKGDKVTVVASSYLVHEAKIALQHLKKYNISCELIDIRVVQPLDWSTIERSVKKTGRLLVLDTGHSNISLASEIVSHASINYFRYLKRPPVKLTMPDIPEPASYGLTKRLFIRPKSIIKEILKVLKIKNNKIIESAQKEPIPHDIPGKWFKGPF